MRLTPRTGDHGERRFGAQTTLAALGALLVGLAQLPACGDEEEDSPPQILNYVTGAQLLDQDAPGVLHNGRLPEGSDAGPTVTVDAESTIINGGSLQVPVEASADIEAVLIGLTIADTDATSNVTAGAQTGYYEVSLPAPTSSATVVLTIAQVLAVSSVTLDVAAVGAGGVVGVSAHQSASAVSVGSGEVQVSVSWDVDSDVDLHVVDGNGDEIYYGATSASSGGSLDLDSNAGCSIDGTRNENITFAEAPPGEYQVLVDYYDSCDVEETNYVVTVNLPGQTPQVFNGVFTGDGDRGGAGDGEFITSFTVAG
jgi:hypothetical protein